MKNIIKYLMIFLISVMFADSLKAQKKFGTEMFKRSVSDSLWQHIYSDIYYSFYNPEYMGNKKAVFTFLKIDINWEGNVTGIGFSDSADSTFLNTYKRFVKKQNHEDVLQKYVTVVKLKSTSLLIPVNYEPDYTAENYAVSRYTLTYKELDNVLKFGKAALTGNTIMLEAINIVVLRSGNR